jgi:hypothetical protein
MKKRTNPKEEAMRDRSLMLESERQNSHTTKYSLTEQTQPSNYNITDNGFIGVYEGVEFSNQQGDIAHQFSNTASNEVGKKLKVLYKKGLYSKVDLDNIKMTTLGMGSGNVTYKIIIPIINVTNKCEAYTSFDHRGGWGHGGSDKKQDIINELGDQPVDGTSLDISKEYKTNEGLVEYWVQWKNKSYQMGCKDGQTNAPTDNKVENITHNNNAETFRQGLGLKGLGIVGGVEVKTNSDGADVTFNTTDKNQSLSYIWSNEGVKGLADVLETVKRSNTILEKIPYDIGNLKGYIIIMTA